MPEEFPLNADENPLDAVLDSHSRSQKRSNQMILIGAPAWVKKIIHLMHVARIAEVRDWSRLMPTRNPNEVISLMQRPRVEE
ncbi:hypothetical protein H6F88_16845 [Oculatella sp. FACHB-28]|uniref:hypothetical protein n=1 Tax=Oculatella sp. FACHB-28 TaxID=2692845 RepID=UPI001683BF9E|nr:hypothetical protein [Oculatella sp. FACHB-28]MBD2057665.1 hypothetical protein [Oculatella sp. FACHB-28]